MSILLQQKPLTEASVGDVVRVDYGKNNSKGAVRRTGTVVKVRDTVQDPVSDKTIRSNHIQRSRYLVTLREESGRLSAFYAEHVAENAYRYTLVGRLVRKVCNFVVRFGG